MSVFTYLNKITHARELTHYVKALIPTMDTVLAATLDILSIKQQETVKFSSEIQTVLSLDPTTIVSNVLLDSILAQMENVWE